MARDLLGSELSLMWGSKCYINSLWFECYWNNLGGLHRRKHCTLFEIEGGDTTSLSFEDHTFHPDVVLAHAYFASGIMHVFLNALEALDIKYSKLPKNQN